MALVALAPELDVLADANLLSFQREATEELLDKDGLCVCAEGLGGAVIVASLIAHAAYEGRRAQLGDPALVTIIIGANDALKVSIKERLGALFPATPAPLEFTADTNGDARAKHYATGCVAFITTRIASVDLLTKRLHPAKVRGIIVCGAHRAHETSGEGFVVRLFREGNRRGFVRAITDRPGDLTKGFNSVERCLKALMVTTINLWPRFHLRVKEDLDAHPPEVVELRQPLSENVLKIQEAIVSVMDTCLQELKKSRYIDTSDLTLENGLFKSFDLILQRQLDQVWHVAPRRLKQIVYDLKTLRGIAAALLKYDSVTFLKYLHICRASESKECMWLFTDAAHAIFEYAKKRVYVLRRATAAPHPKGLGKRPLEPQPSTDLVPILEPMPKWTLVEEILDEIEEEREEGGDALAVARAESVVDLTFSQPYASQGDAHSANTFLKYKQGATIVVCKEEATARQLEQCVRYGTEALMHAHWASYLVGRGVASHVAKRHAARGGGGGRGGYPGRGRGGRASQASTSTAPPRVFSKLERIQARMEGREIPETEDDVAAAPSGGGGKSEEAKLLAAAAAAVKKAKDKDAVKSEVTSGGVKTERLGGDDDAKNRNDVDDDDDDEDVIVVGDTRTRCRRKRDADNIFIYAHERKVNVLNHIQPSFVIMYDPDAAFIRELEVYKSQNPDAPLKVYFMVYDTSLEEQKYLSSIKRESAAFEHLIRTKQHMAIPAEQEGRTDAANPLPLPLPNSLARQRIEESRETSTRKGGGALTTRTSLDVIVDMREFMSALPCVLHAAGFRVRPTTLEVGDYILTPDMCVERKAIPDLIQSFASGRLVAQVEAMCKYYKTPILLIEFDGAKAFALNSEGDLPRYPNQNHIISKLVMLIHKFPKLRLLWSRSMQMTAEMFATLKAVEDEPVLEVAQRIGVPDADGDTGKLIADNVNDAAVDLLRRLPGITDNNYRRVMHKVESIEKLCELTEAQIAEVLGDARQAKTLHTFLHAPFPQEFML